MVNLIIISLFVTYLIMYIWTSAKNKRDRKAQEARIKEHQQQIDNQELELRRQQAEQVRQFKEQQRLANEQKRQAEEQTRQAVLIQKQEERIMKLEQKIALANHDIEYYQPVCDDLKKQIHDMELKIWYYEQKGLPCSAMKEKVQKAKSKLHSVETKVLKANQVKALAERQIVA